MKKSAFTLAEVLITLGIIGVVAAMTLPTIIGNARNKQLETALKRSYSVLGQALDMYQAQNGERITLQTAKEGELKPILMKYLQIVRVCTGFNRDESCISASNPINSDMTLYKNYTRQVPVPTFLLDDGEFVLNDGSLVLIENPGSPKRLYISVDVNGYNKNPNLLGHDLFMFQIDDKGTFLPMGAEGTDYFSKTDEFCSPTSIHDKNGAGCTYKALTDKNYFKNLPK